MQEASTPHELRQLQTRFQVNTHAPLSTLTLASVTLNSRRIYCGMLYSAIGSTTKYW